MNAPATKKGLKLKVSKPAEPIAPAAEPQSPVNAKAKIKMAPIVSDYTPDMPLLPTVSNAKTGSVFHVIGQTAEGLQVSIRAYLNKSDPGFTRLDFRLRIGDKINADTDPLAIPVASFIQSKYPALSGALSESSKASDEHASIEGAILLPANPWEKQDLAQLMTNSDFAKNLLASLQSAFGESVMLAEEHMVNALMVNLTTAAVKDIAVPSYMMADKQVQYRIGLTPTPLLVKKNDKP